MRSITAIPCECENCLWSGVTGDCEPDEDGALGCPECGESVAIDYTDEEMQPSTSTAEHGK